MKQRLMGLNRVARKPSQTKSSTANESNVSEVEAVTLERLKQALSLNNCFLQLATKELQRLNRNIETRVLVNQSEPLWNLSVKPVSTRGH
ncbi:MAG TPA: hypothetical protein V6C76_12680 [Drouetiella sp.]